MHAPLCALPAFRIHRTWLNLLLLGELVQHQAHRSSMQVYRVYGTDCMTDASRCFMGGHALCDWAWVHWTSVQR